MIIKSFSVKGFKSIANVYVENLATINIFFGQNNVGKSNLFQALELAHWLLSAKSQITFQQIKARYGSFLFQIGGNQVIEILVEMMPDPQERISTHHQNSLTIRIEINREKISYNLKNNEQKPTGFLPIQQKDLPSFYSGFHLIDAARRFEQERVRKVEQSIITHKNLKVALFNAYLSREIEQKRRLVAIKNVLQQPPYALGELDVARDPETEEIDIGFIRENGRFPLESLGSGSQQLLLMLGQIFLNDYPIIALEEPEMNLSPQYQTHFLHTLRDLMLDPSVKLKQLFISTHSPNFGFEEKGFFHVTMDRQEHTHIQPATKESHASHFAIVPAGPNQGGRLNALNQVTLYEGVVNDLNLERGDLIYFLKNSQGHWELHSGSDVEPELAHILASHNE